VPLDPKTCTCELLLPKVIEVLFAPKVKFASDYMTDSAVKLPYWVT